jgi:hypothetical protein
MVATPLVRGLLGLTVEDAGRTLSFAPQLPADWDRVAVKNVGLGPVSRSADLTRSCRFDLSMVRRPGLDTITLDRAPRDSGGTPASVTPCDPSALRLRLAPAYPLDAKVQSIEVEGREAKFALVRAGDVQRAEVLANLLGPRVRIVIRYQPGTDAYLQPALPASGERSTGLRLLRSHAEADELRLLLDGRAGQSYKLGVRSPHQIGTTTGVIVQPAGDGNWTLEVAFSGPDDSYVRREVVLPLR